MPGNVDIGSSDMSGSSLLSKGKWLVGIATILILCATLVFGMRTMLRYYKNTVANSEACGSPRGCGKDHEGEEEEDEQNESEDEEEEACDDADEDEVIQTKYACRPINIGNNSNNNANENNGGRECVAVYRGKGNTAAVQGHEEELFDTLSACRAACSSPAPPQPPPHRKYACNTSTKTCELVQSSSAAAITFDSMAKCAVTCAHRDGDGNSGDNHDKKPEAARWRCDGSRGSCVRDDARGTFATKEACESLCSLPGLPLQPDDKKGDDKRNDGAPDDPQQRPPENHCSSVCTTPGIETALMESYDCCKGICKRRTDRCGRFKTLKECEKACATASRAFYIWTQDPSQQTMWMPYS